jgi:cytochrome c-type biogenesis protein CcmE
LDEAGDTSKVVSSEPKQQDFEMTDEVQMVGYMDEGFFRATKVMPKCPSKYEKENELASNNTGT